MSTGFYTHIRNTAVSGSQLLSSLADSDLKSLKLTEKLATNYPLVITANYALDGDSDALIQATAGVQDIDGTALGGSNRNLQLGPDVASTARMYMEFFNITSTTQKRYMHFRACTANFSGVNTVRLANDDGDAGSNITLSLDNTSTATPNMFDLVTGAGAVVCGQECCVEVTATNITSGSEVVNFNVLSAN